MVFKKLFGALGVGAPSVDTVLANPNTQPGLTLDGQVNITGGQQVANVERITVGLVTRVEVESGDQEYDATVEFHRLPVGGPLQLEPGQQLSIPFRFPVPWETPITDVYGQRLRGMTMGLRTELAIARAVDKGDLDPISVNPLPVQERILAAFERLGFRFIKADLERGGLRGVHQTLPFYQEIEFYPAPQYARGVNQVEVTFVANPHSMDVLIEFDKRGGLFTAGHDAFGHYTVQHADADRVDWAAVVDGWVRQALDKHQSFLSNYSQHGHRKGGHHGGVGGMIAGAGLGLAGGMIAGEMIEDAFEGGGDFFE